ncbi:ATP-binding protein [Myxococcota bacterium]|nr:ATP-binding protein [Myxococcota bacterium]
MPLRPNPRLLAFTLLLAGLAAVPPVVFLRARGDAYAEATEEAREEARAVARQLSDNIEDVVGDLQYARQRILLLAPDASAPASLPDVRDPHEWLTRDFQAMVFLRRELQEFGYLDSTGAPLSTVRAVEGGTSASSECPAPVVAEMLAWARDPGRESLYVSSVQRPARAGPAGVRYLAMAVPDPTGAPGVVYLGVDMSVLLKPASLLGTGAGRRLVVFSHRSRVVLDSSGRSAQGEPLTGLEGPGSHFEPLLYDLLEQGSPGTARVDGRRYGTPDLDGAVVAVAPVAVADDVLWGAALIVRRAAIEAPAYEALKITLPIALALAAASAFAVRAWTRRDQRLALQRASAAVVERLPVAVCVVDDDGRIRLANHALASALGLAPEDLAGRDLGGVLPAAIVTRDGREHRLASLVAAGRRVDLASADGPLLGPRPGRYHVSVVPLGELAGAPATLVAIDDQTGVRDAEQALVRAEKLAATGVLVSGLAHEVGTPLGTISALAERMLRRIGPDRPGTDDLRLLIEQTDRIAGLVRSLLSFARERAGAMRPVRLDDVVSRARALLDASFERRGLTLEVDPRLGSLAEVHADPDQLQQVFINLLINAGQACPRGGRVEVRLPHGAPSGDGGGGDGEGAASTATGPAEAGGGTDGGVTVEVRDDGCGIPPDLLPRVFDPFVTGRAEEGGAGLGLAVVARIVHEHGGVIAVRSSPGVGTAFTLTLRAARTEAARK